jgi:hypothetical protein
MELIFGHARRIMSCSSTPPRGESEDPVSMIGAVA